MSLKGASSMEEFSLLEFGVSCCARSDPFFAWAGPFSECGIPFDGKEASWRLAQRSWKVGHFWSSAECSPLQLVHLKIVWGQGFPETLHFEHVWSLVRWDWLQILHALAVQRSAMCPNCWHLVH